MRGNAFWLNPDWSGGTNLRDGADAFWMRSPLVEDSNFCKKHGEWKAMALEWTTYREIGLRCRSCYLEGDPCQQAVRFR